MLRALVSTGGTTDLVSFDATCFKIEIGVKRLIFKSHFVSVFISIGADDVPLGPWFSGLL